MRSVQVGEYSGVAGGSLDDNDAHILPIADDYGATDGWGGGDWGGDGGDLFAASLGSGLAKLVPGPVGVALTAAFVVYDNWDVIQAAANRFDYTSFGAQDWMNFDNFYYDSNTLLPSIGKGKYP